MKRIAVLAAVAFGLALPSAALASHSWGSYHWARTSNPFTLKLGDNVSGVWDGLLGNVSNDWTAASVLNTTIVAGLGGSNCKAQYGRVEVCNRTYGFNGWLGLARIWASGSHIYQAVAKVNDSYFNTSTYDNAYAKRHVLCQEVGHTFGLHHQYAVTCMNDKQGLFDSAYIKPNQHDYDQLAVTYAHTNDSTTTVSSASAPEGPGKGKPQRLSDELWVEDLGNGVRIFTFVVWVDPGVPHDFPAVD